MKNGHRRMRAYGEAEHGGHFTRDHYSSSRNNSNAVTIRRWKRGLKKKARAKNRAAMYRAMRDPG